MRPIPNWIIVVAMIVAFVYCPAFALIIGGAYFIKKGFSLLDEKKGGNHSNE